MNEDARCDGAAERQQPARRPERAARAHPPATTLAGRGSFDPDTGEFTWGDVDPAAGGSTGTVAPQTLGEESWKWLFLQPLTTAQE